MPNTDQAALTAPTSPLPASLLHAEARHDDLEARIRHAELRLIARDEDVRRRIGALGVRLRQAAQPRRYVGAAAGALVTLVTMWWAWRGRPTAPARVSGSAAPAGPARGRSWNPASLPWVQMMGLAWPLLPVAFRSRVSPGTVNFVLSLVLPLMGLLKRTPAAPLATAGPVALRDLSGTWYEVAHLGAGRRGAGQRVVRWAPLGGGELDLLERTPHAGGVQTVYASAVVAEDSGGSQLRVSRWPALLRWLPWAWHDEWVLHLNPSAGEMVLGSPGRDVLRVLARRKSLSPARLQPLVELAREQGFAVERLRLHDPLA